MYFDMDLKNDNKVYSNEIDMMLRDKELQQYSLFFEVFYRSKQL